MQVKTIPDATTCISCLSLYWPLCVLPANQCNTTGICMKTLGTDKLYTVSASNRSLNSTSRRQIRATSVALGYPVRCWCVALLFLANIPVFSHNAPSARLVVVEGTKTVLRICNQYKIIVTRPSGEPWWPFSERRRDLFFPVTFPDLPLKYNQGAKVLHVMDSI